MTRFVCTGDTQIGVGATLDKEPGDRLAEQEKVWARIVEIAHDVRADAILHAGDVFEGPIPTPEHYRAFTRPLEGCEIPVVAITGNGRHDAAKRITTALDVASAPCLFVHSKPGVLRLGQASVAMLPWAPIDRLVAAEGGGDRDDIDRVASAGLIQIARGLYEQAREKPGGRALLGHWHVDTATAANGTPTSVFREPLLPLADLVGLGFDAVVLGHNHRGQMLSRLGEPPVFHVGSPMPHDFGEAAFEHGVWLLDVEPGNAQMEWRPVESRRLVDVTLTGDHALEVVDAEWPPRIDVRDAIVKIRVRATTDEARRLDLIQLKREAEAAGAYKVWQLLVEPDRGDIVRGPVMDETVGDDEALARWLEAASINGTVGADVTQLHRRYLLEAAK